MGNNFILTMAQSPLSYKRFAGGIADSLKEGAAGQIPDQYYFGRSINYRDDPQALTILPGAVKESGNVITDLLKSADIVPTSLTLYSYGNAGTIYSRTSAGSWSALRTVANSHGNGMAYFTGDDYLYYTLDSTIGRYGPVSGTPQFNDNFLQSLGGAAQNTNSLTLVAASSQYASVASQAALQITGNLTIQCYINPTSLPTTGNTMTLVSKWDESGATRSYKFGIAGVSASFGSGTDGNLTISTNTTESPIDSACTGTQGTYTLSATNVSFAAGQQILIHQSQGANAGTWQRTSIVSYSTGTITTNDALSISYTTGAQVRTMPQYGNVTVNGGVTWTAKAWNGSTGGILAFLCNGTLAINGQILVAGGNGSTVTQGNVGGGGTGGGFYGGNGRADYAYKGEGIYGASYLATDGSNNYNGAGAGQHNGNTNNLNIDGPGGGNGSAGGNTSGQVTSYGGSVAGNNSLTTMVFGGGGGGSAHATSYGGSSSGGGSGGGIFFTYASTITLGGSGNINANGGNGGANSDGNGGGGAGGSVLLKCLTATLGSSIVTASGGTSNGSGAGGVGRIHLDYYTSYTGTTSPTLNSTQDNSLSNNTTYQLQLSVSTNGTAYETMARTCTLTTGAWKEVNCVWTAASHQTEFLLNGNSLGTSTGALTAISSNASAFYVGCNKTTVAANFFDGQIDEVRLWNVALTDAQIQSYMNNQISGSTNGLAGYWQFNNNYSDQTSNNNTLTGTNSPTFTTNVPFLASSTRLDIDLFQSATGQTYTVPATITETSANKVSFTPQKEPLKSISVLIAAKGTGDWTLTLHDNTNTLVASATITNANLIVGTQEFVFATPIRPIINAVYHFHVTSTVADGTLVTNTTSDMSTCQYYTYFQYLVTDTQYHPVTQFQYQPLGGTLTGAMVIGNERYLAIWDGYNYQPNFLTLSLGWRVRCFAQWRQYLAIGVWKGTNIYDYQHGRIYFWSGYQPAYDFFIDVPDGQINALFGVDSDLYMFAGFRGVLLDYKGGFFYNTGNTASAKLKRMPLLETNTSTEVYPYAMNMYRGMLHFGLYGASTSTTSQKGVYSFGSLNQYYPDTLSYDYPISTGSRGSTVSVGLVYPIGQNLLIGWQDNTAYGCDVVNFSNPPASTAEIQLLLNDSGAVWKDKNNQQFRIDHSALKLGESITPEISLNRGSFSSLVSSSTVGATYLSQPITTGRAKEIQVGVTLAQTNGTSPTLTAITFGQDIMSSEKQL